MRKTTHEKLEAGRVKTGALASNASYGLTGAFQIWGPRSARLAIISSGPDQESGWEHVSVSTGHRVPNWDEMCYVKDLFWEEEECVIQFHPPKSQYVNCQPHCLHLWRPIGAEILMPPTETVGILVEEKNDLADQSG